MATAQDIVTNALFELNVASPLQAANTADLNYGLTRLNLILDTYNAQSGLQFNVSTALIPFSAFGSPNVSIGPGLTAPNVNAPAPVSITKALIYYIPTAQFQTSNELQIIDPFTFRDVIGVKGLTGMPAYLVQTTNYPNIDLQLYPAPSINLNLEVVYSAILGQLTLSSTITLPPAYQELITLELAIKLAPSYEKQPNPVTVEAYKNALTWAKSQNARKTVTKPDSLAPGYWRGLNGDSYRDGLY